MQIDTFVGQGILLFIYLAIAFVFVVKIRHRVKTTWLEKPTEIFIVLPFVLFDWFVNTTVMTVAMLDPPRGIELVTGRMKRYKRKYAATPPRSELGWWRWGFAIRLCKWMNQRDKEHC